MASPTKKQEGAGAAEEKEELEQDAKREKDPKITQKAAFLTADTTLNVLPSTVGNMLVAMSEGGLSNLIAGARANIGINSGRYMFEAKIVERTDSKSMVRFGFTAGSLFLGEDESSICFDNEGNSITNKKRTKCSMAFPSDTLVAVVLNRDEKSPNKDTISFFKNGVRASQPQPLPDSLKGKTLYPAASFKNCTVHLNFEAPAAPLPFKCNVVQNATQKDATVTKYETPADGKYTALFPICLPDEGTFDWLDAFIEKNPDYTELSDRALATWAETSGLHGSKRKTSNDKPDMGFGHGMDSMEGIKKALIEVASLQPRNLVVMEIKGNLVKEDRLATLAKFKGVFKTQADIVVGEPSSSFKRKTQSKMLDAKQDAADKEFKAKFAVAKREWLVKKKQKEAEKMRKKMEKERKKKAEEAKKKAEEAMKKRAAENAAKLRAAQGKPPEEKKEEEVKPVEIAVDSEEEAEEPDEPEPQETTPPKVKELSAEEKSVRFFKHPVSDLSEKAMGTYFTKFTLPDSDEGFDRLNYSWNKEKEAATYLQGWILAKKQTTRVEDITPSAGFKQKSTTWQANLKLWKAKKNEYTQMLAKKAADKNAKIARKAALEKKAKLEEEKKAKEKAEGKEETEKEEKTEEKAVEVEEEEEEEPQVDFDGLDVFGVDDVLDIGGKVPLFKDFQFEDFTMMSLRAELNLLVHSFGKDCNDPDRTGIHLDHVGFYYQKYYGKPLTAQSFGVKTMAETIALVSDTVFVSEKNIIESSIPDDLETNAVFVKLTEDARRMRNMEVDMGVVSAKLNISHQGHNEGGDHGQKRSFDQSGGGKQWPAKKQAWGAWGGKW